MGIPAIFGLGDALRRELNGRIVYIDGETGPIAIEPDNITLAVFQSKLEMQQEMKALTETLKGQEDVTLDKPTRRNLDRYLRRIGVDLSMLETFLAIGIDELSTSPLSVMPLQAEVCKSIAKTCTLEKLER